MAVRPSVSNIEIRVGVMGNYKFSNFSLISEFFTLTPLKVMYSEYVTCELVSLMQKEKEKINFKKTTFF